MTIQFDATLMFDLTLPPDDLALIRDQTPLTVVVEHSTREDTCSTYSLKIRVGEGLDADEYEQARFVHRSAAEGAAKCLLQYLTSKEKLNVVPTVDSDSKHLTPPDKQSFVPVGWTMGKVESHHTVASSGMVKV